MGDSPPRKINKMYSGRSRVPKSICQKYLLPFLLLLGMGFLMVCLCAPLPVPQQGPPGTPGFTPPTDPPKEPVHNQDFVGKWSGFGVTGPKPGDVEPCGWLKTITPAQGNGKRYQKKLNKPCQAPKRVNQKTGKMKPQSEWGY